MVGYVGRVYVCIYIEGRRAGFMGLSCGRHVNVE